MLFSDIFLSRWWPGGTLTDITMRKRHQGSTRQTESVSRNLVVDKSTNNSSSNIHKISVFGKGKYCFSDPKDRQVKHYYPNKKKLWLSALDLAKKNFWGFKEISNLSFRYMEFVLTKNHFCIQCWSSNYWEFFNIKKSSSLNRSFWNSFDSFIS